MSMSEGIERLQTPVEDGEMLLRLVWDSHDLIADTLELATSAFSKNDLMGMDRGLSVDRQKLAVKSVIISLAEKQMAQVENNPAVNRTRPLLAKARTGDICASVFEDGSKIFSVIATPIAATATTPANPAHAEILNISGKSKKSDINEFRAKLQTLFSMPKPIDEHFPEPNTLSRFVSWVKAIYK